MGGLHRAPRRMARKRWVVATVVLVTAVAVTVGVMRLGDGSSPEPVQVDADGVLMVPSVEVGDQPRLGNATAVGRGTKTTIEGDRLLVPSVSINAPVDQADTRPVDAGVEMVVPDDVSRVAWLDTGAHPGDLVGSSVISGHVSDRVDRPGAMWNLGRVEAGDLVEWVSGGRMWTFVVTGSATYERSASLPDELFDNSGPRTLYLVTCTGRRDLGGGHFTYERNLVLKAELYGTIESVPVNG